MSPKAPRPSGYGPDRAAGNQSGLDCRYLTRSRQNSQSNAQRRRSAAELKAAPRFLAPRIEKHGLGIDDLAPEWRR